MNERPFWNPYLAGVVLGLVLLAAFVLAGNGLGASGAANRTAIAVAHAIAPKATEANPYFGEYVGPGKNPWKDWLVFEVLGVLIGGGLGAWLGGRARFTTRMGPRMTSRAKRLALAFLGGLIMGFAARLARGCTSGQALTGGSLLSLGSWVFMMAVFGGGYLLAPLLRRAWR
ncbi:MAG TPA: YeeE/YedE thiosulfate transporter family protein [Myxococcota bacterium]|nr:YeeE/YedE thiosulfate transporter family protein [Myxococcota bacterium]HQK51372.1 YeeE/YedE thiosulfate transporter family protein [Myxococcota bacterium]